MDKAKTEAKIEGEDLVPAAIKTRWSDLAFGLGIPQSVNELGRPEAQEKVIKGLAERMFEIHGRLMSIPDLEKVLAEDFKKSGISKEAKPVEIAQTWLNIIDAKKSAVDDPVELKLISKNRQHDIEALVSQSFPHLGMNAKEAEAVWNENKLMPKRKDSAFQKYTDNLLAEQKRHFGVSIMDNPRDTKFRIPQLLKAYFMTKHLANDTEKPDWKLPGTTRVNGALALFHATLLDRISKEFSSLSTIEQNQIREIGLQQEGSNNPVLQKVQDMLNAKTYIEKNKDAINEIAEFARKPVEKLIEEAKKQEDANELKKSNKLRAKASSKKFWAGTGNAIAWPFKFTFGTVPVAIGQYVKSHWKPIVVGGVVGGLILPGYGIPIGIAAGTIGYDILKAIVGKDDGHDTH